MTYSTVLLSLKFLFCNLFPYLSLHGISKGHNPWLVIRSLCKGWYKVGSLHKNWNFPLSISIKCFWRILSHLLKKSLMENFIFVQWVIQKFISTALSKDSRSGLLGKVESRGSSTKTQHWRSLHYERTFIRYYFSIFISPFSTFWPH